MELNNNEIAILCEILDKQKECLNYLLDAKDYEEKGEKIIEQEIKDCENLYLNLAKIKSLDISKFNKSETEKLCQYLSMGIEELEDMLCYDEDKDIEEKLKEFDDLYGKLLINN